jgi:hypothetical protein
MDELGISIDTNIKIMEDDLEETES